MTSEPNRPRPDQEVGVSFTRVKFVTKKPKCIECNKCFTNNSVFNEHMILCHGGKDIRVTKLRTRYKCPLCSVNVKDRELFETHILKSHEIRLQKHYYKFKNQSHFLAWKRKVEKETTSSYVKPTKTVWKQKKMVLEETNPCVSKKAGVAYYMCHRSGNTIFTKESERKRRSKVQGSVKINAYCPAKMWTEFKPNGTVRVAYCPTHVGHECEAYYTRLTDEERKMLASKIASNIPYDVILDEIRNSAESSNNISRMHLLTKENLQKFTNSSFYKRFVKTQLPESLSSEDGQTSKVEGPSSDPVEEFEIQEIQPFDLSYEPIKRFVQPPVKTISEVQSSDLLSRCDSGDDSDIGDVQSDETFNKANHSSIRTHQQIQKSPSPTSPLSEESQDLTASFNQIHESIVAEKKKILIKQFSTKVSELKSTAEIKWVERQLNRMFIYLQLQSMEESRPTQSKNENMSNRREGQPKSNSLSSDIFVKAKSPTKPSTSSSARSQLFSSTPQKTFKKTCTLNSYSSKVLKTANKMSIVPSTQPNDVGISKNLKRTSESQTVDTQAKRYLIPLSGKPNMYLVVKPNLNKSSTFEPLTNVIPQVTSDPTDKVNADHCYSSVEQ